MFGIRHPETGRRSVPPGGARGRVPVTGGATGRQVVTTAIVSGPTAQNGADRIQIVRTLASPGAPESVTTLDQWIAQRGDVRVVVQLRYLGAADAAARATTAEFFETAVARAFGGG